MANEDLVLRMGATPGNVAQLLDGVVTQNDRAATAIEGASNRSERAAEASSRAWQQHADMMGTSVIAQLERAVEASNAASEAVASSAAAAVQSVEGTAVAIEQIKWPKLSEVQLASEIDNDRVVKQIKEVAEASERASQVVVASGEEAAGAAKVVESRWGRLRAVFGTFGSAAKKAGGLMASGFKAAGAAAFTFAKAGLAAVGGLVAGVAGLAAGPLVLMAKAWFSAAKETKEYEAAQERLQGQLSRIGQEILHASGGVDGLVKLMDLLTAGIRAVTPWIAGFAAAIVAMAKTSFEIAKEIGRAFADLFEGLLGDFGAFVSQARQVAQVLAVIPGPMQGAAQAIVKATSGFEGFKSVVRELTGGEFSIIADGLDAFVAAYDEAQARLDEPLAVVDEKEAERRSKLLARFSEERLDGIAEEIDALKTLGLSHEQEGVFLDSIASSARDAQSALVTAWREGLIQGDAFTKSLERLNVELSKVEGLEEERERIKQLQAAAAKKLAQEEKARLKALEEEARLLGRFSDKRLLGLADELEGVQALNLSQEEALRLIQAIGGDAEDARAALTEAFRGKKISADEFTAGLVKVNEQLDKVANAERLQDLEDLKTKLREQRELQIAQQGGGDFDPQTAEQFGQLPFADQVEGLGLGFGPELPEEQAAGQILDTDQVELWREVMGEVAEARLEEEDARERLIDAQIRWNSAAQQSLQLAVKEGQSFAKRKKFFGEATKVTQQFASALVDMAISGELSGKKLLAASLKMLSDFAKNKMLENIARAYELAAVHDYKGAAMAGLAAAGWGVLAAGAGIAAASVGSEAGRDEPGSAEGSRGAARSNEATSDLEDQELRTETAYYVTGNVYGGGTPTGLSRELQALGRDAENASDGRRGTDRMGGP